MSDTMKIAYSLEYGYLKEYKDKTKEVAMIMKDVVEHARRLLTLPASINLTVRPLRGLNGQYNHMTNTIEVDPRYNPLGVIVETIMHELVHAEQFFTGRLKIAPGPRGGTFTWQKSETYHGIGTTIAEYKARPWEAEAFKRQNHLAIRVSIMVAESKGVDVTYFKEKYGVL